MAGVPRAADGDRVPWLDGMRGLAVLLVMAVHLPSVTRVPSPSRFDRAVTMLSQNGWIGVDLFFVLSGMLITGILLDTKGSIGYWRRFYVRRVLRIFPLYYAFLIAVFMLAPLMYPSEGGAVAELRHAETWFALYLTNGWVAARHGVDFNLFGTGPVWSLSVEEQFYLLWPFVVLLLSRRGLTVFCVGLVVFAAALRLVLLAAGAAPVVVYEATPARCDTLALGALLALALRDDTWRAQALRHARPVSLAMVGLLVLLGIACHGLAWPDKRVLVYGLTPIALLMASLVAQGFRGGAVAAAFSASPMRWLGRYSYAIYLFHLPIGVWLCEHWHAQTRLMAHGIPEAVADPLCWLAVSAITFAAAWVSWQVYEKQFLKLKRFVRYERGVEVAPVPVAASIPVEVMAETA
ncbi:MAG TPA: acyltransferase [Dehalococcoidia bacterium]|nr:acyltransferase [Dehalococcoidia bacterium]